MGKPTLYTLLSLSKILLLIIEGNFTIQARVCMWVCVCVPVTLSFLILGTEETVMSLIKPKPMFLVGHDQDHTSDSCLFTNDFPSFAQFFSLLNNYCDTQMLNSSPLMITPSLGLTCSPFKFLLRIIQHQCKPMTSPSQAHTYSKQCSLNELPTVPLVYCFL